MPSIDIICKYLTQGIYVPDNKYCTLYVPQVFSKDHVPSAEAGQQKLCQIYDKDVIPVCQLVYAGDRKS